MKRHIVIVLLVYCVMPDYAISEIYKCKDSEGGISFQEKPCLKYESSMKINNPTLTYNKTNKTKPYISDTPVIAELKPSCNKDGGVCTCRGVNYSYFMDGKNHYRLFDRLRELPGYWNEYNKLLGTHENNKHKNSSQTALNLAGCKILLAQLFIEKNHQKIKSILTKNRDRYDESGHVSRYKIYKDYLSTLADLSKNVGIK